jgi:hypothetical protein
MPEISGSLAAKEARDDFATDPADSKPVGAPASTDGLKHPQPTIVAQPSAYEPPQADLTSRQASHPQPARPASEPPRPADGPEVDYLPDVPENTPDDHPSRSRPAARPCPAGP